jgi:GMP synthase PP-ATPase subunit
MELGFELVEPLRMLFKDEVRKLGAIMDVPTAFLARHPFPGPGTAVADVARHVIGRHSSQDTRILNACR